MSLGMRIKEYRIKNGYTQGQIADKLKMTEANFSSYERDKSIPPKNKLEEISQILNVSTDYLLYGFNRVEFARLSNIARGQKSTKEFAEEAGLDSFLFTRLCSEVEYQQPSIETVEKIIKNNQSLKNISSEILKAASHNPEEFPELTRDQINMERLTKESALTLINNPQELAKLDKEALSKLHSYIGAVLDFSNKDDFTPKQFELLNRFCNLSPIEQQTILSVMKTFEEEKKTKSEQAASLEVG
jgi:transcriptional regulator with XRE-family HTH domain